MEKIHETEINGETSVTAEIIEADGAKKPFRIDIMTLFPELVETVLSESIIGRARKSGHIEIHAHNIRDYSEDKHRRVDDTPCGGGKGMLMAPPPIYRCYEAVMAENGVKVEPKYPEEDAEEASVKTSAEDAENGAEAEASAHENDCAAEKKTHVIYMSPRGRTFTQKIAKELSEYEHLVILCGHYEGVDQRIIDEIIDEELSIGDYVLTGGEIPACIVADAVGRLLPGVLSEDECFEKESFENNLLEYPQYTRPIEFHGRKVPDVLLSGHHANIEKWRHEKALEITKKNRPDLYASIPPEPEKKKKRRKKTVADNKAE